MLQSTEPLNCIQLLWDVRYVAAQGAVICILPTGLGNWVSVADHVANKTAVQCKNHYFQTYINTETFPYPMAAPELANLTEVIAKTRPGINQSCSPCVVMASCLALINLVLPAL
jgi:hypothetical protein